MGLDIEAEQFEHSFGPCRRSTTRGDVLEDSTLEDKRSKEQRENEVHFLGDGSLLFF